MIHRHTLRRFFFFNGSARVWVGLCLATMIGCNPQQLMRGKSEEETEHDRYADVKTIRDFTSVGNADPVAVGGVGLVSGLDGTGGDSPPDSYRTLLEEQLRKADPSCSPKKLLADPQYSMVIVTGLIQPGVRDGEPFDVEVRLPRGSRATSLRGGVLQKCKLFTYAQASSLRSDYGGSGELVLGHAVATAAGPLLVGMGFDKDEDEARLKKARIWGGGRSRINAAMTLRLNSDKQSARIAGSIAARINEAFRNPFPPGSQMQVAVAHDNVAINLNVPQAYRLNLPHYLCVILAIPMHDPGNTPSENGLGYHQRLATDLLDPARTLPAAVRLEALGEQSVPALRAGLKSKDVLVRFASAESLAYLGNSAGAEELATIAQTQPYLVSYALTALASLDQKVSAMKLNEILLKSELPEVRYGAFRALRTLDDKNDAVAGEYLNDSFWLHHVASHKKPLIHISSTKRPEIVLFGPEAQLIPPFPLRAGSFCVTATENDHDHCMISVVPPDGGSPLHKECPLSVDAVLRTLAGLGATYPEVIEILQQANQLKCLSCDMRADALPQRVSVQELADAGKHKGDAKADGDEILLHNPDLGATPGLFDNARMPKANPFSEGAPVQPERKSEHVIGGDN
jgi:hypothetical protein